MKKYLADMVLCTIVAGMITLLWYILGIDKSWNGAAATFGSSFLIMVVLGLWKRNKETKQ